MQTQKSKPEIMGIRFYSNRDMALGQFLVDNCFQLRASGSSSALGLLLLLLLPLLLLCFLFLMLIMCGECSGDVVMSLLSIEH